MRYPANGRTQCGAQQYALSLTNGAGKLADFPGLTMVSSWYVVIAALYVGASMLCFLVYALDKSAARAGRRRTPERTLLLLGLCCGWPGGLLAQRLLRHKSSKQAFLMKFWLTVVVNVGVIAGVAYLALTA